MEDSEILHIFVEVSGGRENHGDFLMSFARAVCFADSSNFELVREAALLLITKYRLNRYLNNYEKATPKGISHIHTTDMT